MTLPVSRPTAQGVDPRGILDFLDAVADREVDLHSLAIARHGQAVARGWWRPHAADRVQLLYSISKSLTATAIAFLAQEGVLRLDDPVLQHLPVHPGSVDERWSAVRLRHCLSMTIGHREDAWGPALRGWVEDEQRDLLDGVLALPPTEPPGTTFAYNQVATYLLSRVVTHRTGRRVVDALRPRLFDPLDMGEVLWHTDPAGHDLGFSGVHLSTDGLLAFTQFVLDRGRWQGRRLLDEAWFDEASRPFGPPNREPGASPDWTRGYGYSFWLARHGFRGDGAYGQFAIILPEQDAAIAITSEHDPMQDTLDLVWAHLLPALRDDIDPDPAGEALLADRLAHLGRPPQPSTWPGPDVARFTRSANSQLPTPYAAVSVRRPGPSDGAGFADGWVLGLERDGTSLPVTVGDAEWTDSVIEHGGIRLPVSARGGWADEDTFRAEVAIIETPHTVLVEGHRSTGLARLTWRSEPLGSLDPLSLAVRRDATRGETPSP